MAASLVRIPADAYAALKRMSKETDRTMTDLLANAIDRYSRHLFWEEVNRAYDAWTPQQKRKYRKEFQEWEAFAGDTWPKEDWEDEWRAQQRASATVRRSVVDGSGSRSRSRAGRAKAGSRRLR